MASINDIQTINEGTPPIPVVNANFDAVKTLLGTAVGGTGAAVTAINIPASRTEWTRSSMILSAGQVAQLAATGLISHSATEPLYGPETGPAALVFAIIPTADPLPVGEVAGQIDYSGLRSIMGIGELILRVRDVGGSGDNQGSLDVDIVVYPDVKTAPALMNHRHNLADVRNLTSSLNALSARITALGG